MALSTSELVTDTSSESSAGGQSGVAPASAPVFTAGFESWLREVRPLDPPDTIRHVFLLTHE